MKFDDFCHFRKYFLDFAIENEWFLQRYILKVVTAQHLVNDDFNVLVCR